ncbi:Hypothetical predicted protein [Octopus vulgaris]|uniref:Uncharacterized protein n=1 Tax=Octopus vulgaris TaxID=6645 RepID=A0AA36F2T1_OCTVU|nr:Hypothetical predicted protein [Octopus vulgaris]
MNKDVTELDEKRAGIVRSFAEGYPPNYIIAVRQKINDFPRTTAQIEFKKREFLRSYALIRQHTDTLDIILGGDCAKDEKKEEQLRGPTSSQKNKAKVTSEMSANEEKNDNGPAPNKSEDQRGVRGERGKYEQKPIKTKAVKSKEERRVEEWEKEDTKKMLDVELTV